MFYWHIACFEQKDGIQYAAKPSLADERLEILRSSTTGVNGNKKIPNPGYA